MEATTLNALHRHAFALIAAAGLAVLGCSSGGSSTVTKYGLAGSVSGLAGAGLVLHSSLGDDLSIAADGAFAFPTKGETGAAYAITVAQQPTSPWQTCSVANGSGTIAKADVAVTVTCTTNRYHVGVTVSGLAGTGLVLNALGEDLPVSANGPVAFVTTAASGSSFTVTIKTQPTAPAQVCTVANGTGTVAGADVGSVTVSCTTGFQVRANVSGLAGTGLVLRVNGGNDLAVSANGVIPFATSILSGDGYFVSVFHQPTSPSQTCSIAQPTGTVTTGDVTVDVACVTDTFAVGGTVTGLVGSGLVLHSDAGAGEDLTVASGATGFTFVGKAASGSTVTVTVGTQPTSPAETCTVQGSPFTVGAADVLTLSVSCTTALQRWAAPLTWGGLWPDDANMVEHASFDGTQIVETKGVAWTVVNGTLPVQKQLKAFPGARFGAGPFNGPRYQASGGDAGLDFPTDMLVCAVVKPDFDPVVDGGEHVIIAKGVGEQAGWELIQKHHMFNFYYRWDDGLGNNFTGNAYTPTYFADASLPNVVGGPGNGPLNPSYVVVCGGRSGDTLVAAVNSFPDTTKAPLDSLFFTQTLPAGATLHAGTTPHRLTIGGYDTSDPNHAFGGRVYETAIWSEPATVANIQAKFSAFQNLAAGAHYTRNREGPFVGPDGQYHTAARNAPRAYLPNAATGFGGGYLFGLQSWNRLTAPYTPPAFDTVPQINPVVAFGEALDLWTLAGGATVLKDQLVPPGDSEQPGAERVTLPAGASISTPLGFFDSAGPIHGMMWIQPVSAAGTLQVTTTNPAPSSTSQHTIDLAALPATQWTRVWLTGLTNDGSQATAATLSLTNTGASPIDFYAWGIDLTQIGRGGDLGAFDPGIAMYDWTGTANKDNFPADVLQLPAAPSTAGTGYCLSVEAQPPAGLDWLAPFVADRSPLSWVSDANATDLVNIFVSGTSNPISGTPTPQPKVCGFASTATGAICFVPTWAPGSQHTLTLCTAPTGDMTFFADGAQVGTPRTGAAPFDLSTGHLLVGSNSAAKAAVNIAGWQGFITKVALCPAGNPGACR